MLIKGGSTMDEIIYNNEFDREEPATQMVIDELRYAGFWMRLWAYLVDIIVLFSISGIFTSLLSLSGAYSNYSLLGLITAKAIVTGIIYYSYFLLMTKLTNQTVGKMIFNLKVVSETNEKLTWLDLFFREIIGRFIYNSIFIMKVLYLVVAFTPKKQGIHDMIGKTKVIHND